MRKAESIAAEGIEGLRGRRYPHRNTEPAPPQYARPKSEVYWSPKTVDLFSFDESYLRRLQERDAATEAHFVSYFGDLLRAKLRSRFFSSHAIEDVQQETFSRVITAVQAGEIRQPDRLGAFVNSVCNNVRLELWRDVSRNQNLDAASADMADPHADLEEKMLQQERVQIVRQVLVKLSPRDREILRAVLDERDKDEICKEFDVDRGYLRVLLHRAKKSFKTNYKKNKN
ncbi:MAG TPA: sigma-70 family RNA polymerase sigma factor [Candidatus Angelobacter sp.]|nr:sigma-70 family RNA polymerase sigma factor [Candidatus Angelobacter sp.]